MTLLTICNQVAEECAIYSPATIVNNTEETAVRLLALAQASGKALARKHDWTVLQTEHTFTTANGTASYTIPSDFRSILGGTVWNRDQYNEIRGGLTAREWQEWKSDNVAVSTFRQRYRIKPTSGTARFYLDPTPTAAEDCVFEYVSDNWCESSGGTGQSAWAADDDAGRIEEYLIERGVIWRLLRAIGKDYSSELAEYNAEVARAFARDGGSPVLNLSRNRGKDFGFRMPETGAG